MLSPLCSPVPDTVWRINLDVPEEAKSVSLDNTDDRWWEQVDLTKLILASNALTSLGDGLAQLPALTVLDVSERNFIEVLLHKYICTFVGICV